MDRAQIVSLIKEIVNAKHIKVDWSEPNFTRLPFKHLGIDSLDLFDIVSTLEDRLNIRFSDETLINLLTLEDLLNSIEELKKSA